MMYIATAVYYDVNDSIGFIMVAPSFGVLRMYFVKLSLVKQSLVKRS